jgi:hypothetical protein
MRFTLSSPPRAWRRENFFQAVIRDSVDQIARRFRQRRRRRVEAKAIDGRIDNFLTGLLGHDSVFQNGARRLLAFLRKIKRPSFGGKTGRTERIENGAAGHWNRSKRTRKWRPVGSGQTRINQADFVLGVKTVTPRDAIRSGLGTEQQKNNVT